VSLFKVLLSRLGTKVSANLMKDTLKVSNLSFTMTEVRFIFYLFFFHSHFYYYWILMFYCILFLLSLSLPRYLLVG
jgi:hypothetical protein